MRYPCLVMDHDDTVVDSSATIHYPCFLEFLEQYRPGMHMTLEDYFLKNFDPGFLEMCRQDFHMTEQELVEEQDYWREYMKGHVPKAVPGIRQVLWRHVERGGTICVVSHSMCHNIKRDWEQNGLPEPALIFGWDDPVELRKPSPYPLYTIMDKLGFPPEELLVVDDLKPGYDMAKAVGVDFAAAGWTNSYAPIAAFMRKYCTYYVPTVEAFGKLLEA